MFKRYGVGHISTGARVLELGPDAIPSAYQSMIDTSVSAWDTADFGGRSGLTYGLVDPYRFPVDDAAYDVVLSGQVIEHVPKIWRWMPEVARVTRPGGTIITVAPISWPYHEDPHDCWRIYPDGLRALYEDAGLDVLVAEWGSLELDPIVRRLPARLQARAIWQRLSTSILLLHERTRLRNQGAGHDRRRPEAVMMALPDTRASKLWIVASTPRRSNRPGIGARIARLEASAASR